MMIMTFTFYIDGRPSFSLRSVDVRVVKGVGLSLTTQTTHMTTNSIKEANDANRVGSNPTPRTFFLIKKCVFMCLAFRIRSRARYIRHAPLRKKF